MHILSNLRYYLGLRLVNFLTQKKKQHLLDRALKTFSTGTPLGTIWGHLFLFLTWILSSAIETVFGCLCSMECPCVNQPVMACLATTFDDLWTGRRTASPQTPNCSGYWFSLSSAQQRHTTHLLCATFGSSHTYPTMVSYHTIHAGTPTCLEIHTWEYDLPLTAMT